MGAGSTTFRTAERCTYGSCPSGNCYFTTAPFPYTNAQTNTDSWEAYENGVPNPNNTRYMIMRTQAPSAGGTCTMALIGELDQPLVATSNLIFHIAGRRGDNAQPVHDCTVRVGYYTNGFNCSDPLSGLTGANTFTYTCNAGYNQVVAWNKASAQIHAGATHIVVMLRFNDLASLQHYRMFLDDFHFEQASGLMEQDADPAVEDKTGMALPTSNILAVWPNPANGHINVSTTAMKAGDSLEIVSSMGQVIMQVRVTDNAILDMDISHLPTGVYMVRDRNSFTERVARFTKE